MMYILFLNKKLHFTPLKIYNGTPEGVPLEIQWQQLPINELNGTPPKGGVSHFKSSSV
jgi:hypothetical protein